MKQKQENKTEETKTQKIRTTTRMTNEEKKKFHDSLADIKIEDCQ